MKSTCVKGFDNLFSIDQSYETRVKLFMQSASISQASVAESYMDDDIETSQSSQESDSDVDIGTKASTYKSATLNEMYTVGLTLRNNLHNCTSAWYKNWPPRASDITGIMLMC
jgi:hypothetical protein